MTIQRVTREEGLNRLLELADILDVADAEHAVNDEPSYSQDIFFHECGTPACAGGHWAVAHPERWIVRDFRPYLREAPPSHLSAISERGTALRVYESLRIEFALTYDEGQEIFGGNGCGNAHTGKQAAAYIREFVEDERKAMNA